MADRTVFPALASVFRRHTVREANSGVGDGQRKPGERPLQNESDKCFIVWRLAPSFAR